MAYAFGGINQALSIASAPVTAAPLTIFAAANVAVVGTQRMLVSISAAASADRFELEAAGASFPMGARSRAQSSSPAATAQTLISSVIAQNTWCVLTSVEESSTSRYVFFNDTKSAQETTSVTPATPTRMFIGGRTTASALLNGLAAEVALWNVALTDAEVTSLARGFKPFRIRPQSLQFYAPIVRNLQDLRGARTITNNNTATVADHPRVY